MNVCIILLWDKLQPVLWIEGFLVVHWIPLWLLSLWSINLCSFSLYLRKGTYKTLWKLSLWLFIVQDLLSVNWGFLCWSLKTHPWPWDDYCYCYNVFCTQIFQLKYQSETERSIFHNDLTLKYNPAWFCPIYTVARCCNPCHFYSLKG